MRTCVGVYERKYYVDRAAVLGMHWSSRDPNHLAVRVTLEEINECCERLITLKAMSHSRVTSGLSESRGHHPGASRRGRFLGKKTSQPISRVLSRTIIHLGHASPRTSSDLPGDTCGPHARLAPHASLFGLAPGGVYRATECCHRCGALLPHHFTLTGTAPEGEDA